ncbi:TetR/AcrR family transcriptional regulator [Actinospica robiniae]|uniref:TetR/AcrR family transcriptional regulator n=1 Tax=Actinospica robiniae TaxID=304901 RepID=UPI000403FF54|nr:TetR/AcrR family transcriptional regulator [Actinospica robiniae]
MTSRARSNAPAETGPEAAARPKPLRADAARNRAKVLDAARAAFAAEGIAVPLDEIARRAGVGAGTVYRHFPTKEALFEAVVADRLDALAAQADAALTAEDPGAAFFHFFDSMLEDADDKKDLADALTAAGVGLSPETLASAARLQNALGALLDRALAAGAVRAGLTVEDLHALAVGALAAESRAAAGPGHRPGRLTRLICDGLRP